MKKNETLEYDTIVALLKKCKFSLEPEAEVKAKAKAKAKKVPKLTEKPISKEKRGVKKMESEEYVKRCKDQIKKFKEQIFQLKEKCLHINQGNHTGKNVKRLNIKSGDCKLCKEMKNTLKNLRNKYQAQNNRKKKREEEETLKMRIQILAQEFKVDYTQLYDLINSEVDNQEQIMKLFAPK